MATETTKTLKNRITEEEARRERERKRAKARAEAAKKKAAKPKPKEKVGTGRDDSQANYERLSAGLRARLRSAEGAGNQKLVAKYKAQLAALKETVQ